MFGKNTYLHLPPHVAANSVVDLNGNEIHLHHDMLTGHHYLSTNASVILESSTALYNNFNQNVGGGTLNNGDPNSTMQEDMFPTKQAVKKDRHSKIYTAQGPRDRRVRLSIGIARKFFDLQEMLGFDKPSKTLDWLLTKSKAAIKDLVQLQSKSANNNNSNINSSSDGDHDEDVVSAEGINSDSKGKSSVAFSKANNKLAAMDSALNLAKEARAKARARARERTKEKMCIKQQLNEARNMKGSTSCHDQWNPFNLIQSSGNRDPIFHCPSSAYNFAVNEDLSQQSLAIKRNKFHHQQQNFSSTAASDENWDQSNFNSQSNQLCAILNQHKFIN